MRMKATNGILIVSYLAGSARAHSIFAHATYPGQLAAGAATGSFAGAAAISSCIRREPASITLATQSRTPRLVLSAADAAAVSRPETQPQSGELATCKYDHLQFFVDNLQTLSHYKAIEDRLNEFAMRMPKPDGSPTDVDAASPGSRIPV